MNAIKDLFQEKRKDILSIYFTAGYPELEDTNNVIQSLIEGGVDMIEIGMPYSDPVADGPVIQESSSRALANGMTIKKLFEQLKKLKPINTKKVPLILMGYLNPVMQYGFEEFCCEASACGISGMIIPDLPMMEFENDYRDITKKYNLDFIFLVTPETSEERIRQMDAMTDSFLYAVSASSTTGGQTNFEKKEQYFSRLQSLSLKNPFLIGFGINDHESFQQACRYASGAIVGTAFIKILDNPGNRQENIAKFVKQIRS